MYRSEQMGCDCTLRYVKEDEHKKMEPDTEKVHATLQPMPAWSRICRAGIAGVGGKRTFAGIEGQGMVQVSQQKNSRGSYWIHALIPCAYAGHVLLGVCCGDLQATLQT